MDNSRGWIDHNHEPTTENLRVAIARALDGAPPESDVQAVAAYRTAMVPVSSALNRQLRRLQVLGTSGRVAAPARFDVSRRLLHVLGVNVTPTCAIPAAGGWPGVIFIGCVPNGEIGRDRWIAAMLHRGAIVVSSDRSAGMESIGRHLAVEPGCPGRRARFAVDSEIVESLEAESPWSRFVTEMHPPVWLPPGHLPLSHEQPIGVRVIAHDGMTGDPLIVRVPALGGQVIHSVAHWWQETEPDATELGRRSLGSIAAFAETGFDERGASVGWFGAASAMLATLLIALDGALDELNVQQPASLIPPAVELD